MIPRIVIDSSSAITQLCMLGSASGTDKSPYNTVAHRHPYTAVYSMLFAPLKNKAICFGEIGVAGGRSALLWDMYFTNPATRINMFDRDENFLENARRMVGSRLSFSLMDVGVDGDVARALGIALYDVIIDDSSHNFYDQIRIIKEAWPMIRSGGMLIIEDVFRTEDEERYTNAIQEILSEAAMSYFVMCEHVNRWSPGWDNDKLLVLVKA